MPKKKAPKFERPSDHNLNPISLSYCDEKCILAAGTNSGHILMWKCGVPGGGFGVQRPSDEDWRPLPRVNVGPTVRSVDWGGVNRY